MASGKKAAKTKRATASKSRHLSGFLKKEEREVSKKFHGFLDAWKTHLHDEMQTHKKFLKGSRSLEQRVEDTVKMHKKFLKKIGSI